MLSRLRCSGRASLFWSGVALAGSVVTFPIPAVTSEARSRHDLAARLQRRRNVRELHSLVWKFCRMAFLPIAPRLTMASGGTRSPPRSSMRFSGPMICCSCPGSDRKETD